MELKDKIYKKIQNLQAWRNEQKGYRPIAELQRLLVDYKLQAQIRILKEMLKGDLRKLKTKYGDYNDYDNCIDILPKEAIE